MVDISLKNLQQIPGVGKVIAQDMVAIGINSCDDLKGADPEQLYEKLCSYKACRVDRCMLYVFRCAIYWASNNEHDPELLKWWNWKD
ncbi:MAG: helix-hairpin-helix domain-containing protein, partial [Candidatus Omnitrophica bacterium]|nr:helix-hairpin-helix domain-containing protein [Candidatus Omnitrophota bacterium]